MHKTLFLYLDILGFSELIKTPSRVDQIFAVLDTAALHRDSNFRAIAFSDTLLAYHTRDGLKGSSKAVELMFLIELVQDIFLRLIGSGTYFRAVITEGAFHHSQLQNMQAFYGQALIDAYQKEKAITGTGLYLDRRLEQYDQVFRHRPYSSDFLFVCLTHTLTRLTPQKADLLEDAALFADPDFPIPGEVLASQGMEYMVYPEIVYLKDVFSLKDSHPLPDVREKHLVTWNMYEHAYPKLVKSLVECDFSANGVANMDWTSASEHFENSRGWKAQPHVGGDGSTHDTA